jgi:enoyl-CoA hydratase/3-hydroxyacyl-CoA dehydrogenase
MQIDKVRKVAILGAGAMGHGIAQVFAQAGYETIIRDVKQEFLDNAIAKIGASLDFLVQKKSITPEDKTAILSQRIRTTLDTREAVGDAQLVIEAVPELLDLKRKIFKEVSAMAPEDAILATNTSTMSITDIAGAVALPGRFVGLHFFNPVTKMKLVEIIRGEHTENQCMDAMTAVVQKIKKVPVSVLKDAPGFIVNRINAPNQALMNAILDEGKIRPDEIDTTMKRMGIPMGPFELADFVGIDVFCHTLEYYAEKLSPDYKPGKVLHELMTSGRLGMKSGQGIYKWIGEKAQIDSSKPSTDISPKEFLAIQLNEAIKVFKEGIARSTQEIDQAVVHGMRAFAGPFALCAGMTPAQMTEPLTQLQQRFKLAIFTPEPELVDGSFKKFSTN